MVSIIHYWKKYRSEILHEVLYFACPEAIMTDKSTDNMDFAEAILLYITETF